MTFKTCLCGQVILLSCFILLKENVMLKKYGKGHAGVQCYWACFLNFHVADDSSLGIFSEIYTDRVKSHLSWQEIQCIHIC